MKCCGERSLWMYWALFIPLKTQRNQTGSLLPNLYMRSWTNFLCQELLGVWPLRKFGEIPGLYTRVPTSPQSNPPSVVGVVISNITSLPRATGLEEGQRSRDPSSIHGPWLLDGTGASSRPKSQVLKKDRIQLSPRSHCSQIRKSLLKELLWLRKALSGLISNTCCHQ